MESDIINYRKSTTLAKGLHVTVRVLTPADRDGLLTMFACATRDDLVFPRRRDEPRAGLVVGRTCGREARRPTGGRHRRAHRRPGDVAPRTRLQPARGRGAYFCVPRVPWSGRGPALIQGIVDVAKLAGLHHIFTLSVSPKMQDMRAFEGLGFRTEGTLRDRFMDAEGNTYDMIEMALHLKRDAGF